MKNESVFPTTNPETGIAYGGLTKREWFAGLAMQGLCANSIAGKHRIPNNLVREALEYADALIAELELTNQGQSG